MSQIPLRILITDRGRGVTDSSGHRSPLLWTFQRTRDVQVPLRIDSGQPVLDCLLGTVTARAFFREHSVSPGPQLQLGPQKRFSGGGSVQRRLSGSRTSSTGAGACTRM